MGMLCLIQGELEHPLAPPWRRPCVCVCVCMYVLLKEMLAVYCSVYFNMSNVAAATGEIYHCFVMLAIEEQTMKLRHL